MSDTPMPNSITHAGKTIHENAMRVPQLVFVYNAGSGLFSTMIDFTHKILSPSTYNCKLCALTFGNFSEKIQWKEFIERLPIKTVFLHKDEFLDIYKMAGLFPAVFYDDGVRLDTFLSKAMIEQCASVEGLMELVSNELANYDQRHHSNI